MELQGKVIAVLEAKSGISKATGNPWMSQEYVIETHEQFPKKLCFRVFGEDKIRAFNIQLGEEINVFFDLNSREYQGRYYTDITAWRIDRNDPNAPQNPIPAAGSVGAAPFPPAQDQAPTSTTAPAQQPQPSSPVEFNQSNPEDDLPF